MSAVSVAVVLFSVLFPARVWFPPDQPITIDVRPDGAPVTLVLTDFTGKPFDTPASTELSEPGTVDLRQMYEVLGTPGTYVLYAVPKDQDLSQFVGTPLIIDVRRDLRRDAPATPMVVKVSPLVFAKIETDRGQMTVGFYFASAPETVANFLALAEGGFFDGLSFHRIVPEFIIQSGDPRGDGTGGPGYRINAEFNDRRHDLGVLSMAREPDPIEKQGAQPRPEFADSAGSQFFICLKRTAQLDRRYTAFGRVVEGLDVVQAIGKTPVGGDTGDVPQEKVLIRKVTIHPVTAQNNPYDALLRMEEERPTERSTD